MAALSVHSQPYPEASLCPAAPLPSQRLTRHALAILQLLTTEGDGVTVGDEGPLHDRKTQERKILSDQIMKLVLGILHLLNEGLETAAPFSEDDWLSVEKEQRQLYSDLITDNNHTLGTLGSFTVKSEDVSAPEIEEAEEQEEEASEVTEMSEDPLAAPSGGLNRYADSHTDLPKPELTESPSLASYQNPFLDSLKSGGLPMFPDAASYSDPVAGSYISHPVLNPFPRSFPESSKDACMTTAVVEAASMLGNGMADPYLGNSSDDFPEGNKASFRIKQESPPPCLQPPEGPRETDNNSGYVRPQPAQQMAPRRRREPAMISGMRRMPALSRNDFSHVPNPPHMTAAMSNATYRPRAHLPSAGEKHSERKRFACSQCHKSFNRRAHLIMHQRVHTRERPYVCHCGKAFTQSSNLFRHQRGHSVERMAGIRIKQEGSTPDRQSPISAGKKDMNADNLSRQQSLLLSCRKRGKSTQTSNTIRNSTMSSNNLTQVSQPPPPPPPINPGLSQAPNSLLINVEGNNKVVPTSTPPKKPYACEQCEKSFICRSHLIMHQRVHTRERPYVCECGKTFTQSSNLFRHQRSHRHHRLQLSGYACPQCDKDFPDLSRLLAHQTSEHGTDPFLDVA